MRDYRLFWADGERRVMRMNDFTAQSDEEALCIARALDKKAICELWTGDRLVGTVPPATTAAR